MWISTAGDFSAQRVSDLIKYHSNDSAAVEEVHITCESEETYLFELLPRPPAQNSTALKRLHHYHVTDVYDLFRVLAAVREDILQVRSS